MDPIGGDGKFVEAEETFMGGKSRNRAYRDPPLKEAVMALVARGGLVASCHVPNVTAQALKPIIAEALSTDSHFRADESVIAKETCWMTKSRSSARQPDNRASQRERFVQTAHEIGCDEDEAAFEENLKRIATARPVPKSAHKPKQKWNRRERNSSS